MIPAEVLAFRIGVARCWIRLRARQLVSALLQRFELAPASPFSSEIEMAVDGIRVGMRICSRHGSRLVESQFAGRHNQETFGVAACRGAIRWREAPTPLQSCRNVRGAVRAWSLRSGGILWRKGGRVGRRMVRGNGKVHGFGVVCDRIGPAARSDGQQEGAADEGDSDHPVLTISPCNLLQAPQLGTVLSSCRRRGSGRDRRFRW